MKQLKLKLKRALFAWASNIVKAAGMVIVPTEDWDTNLAISRELFVYVRTSGHINNGRHKSRKRLYNLTDNLLKNAGSSS